MSKDVSRQDDLESNRLPRQLLVFFGLWVGTLGAAAIYTDWSNDREVQQLPPVSPDQTVTLGEVFCTQARSNGKPFKITMVDGSTAALTCPSLKR